MKKYLILLSAVILLAVFLRLYHLSSMPQGLNLDEVSMGYNAYSILKTGHDEYGRFFPIFFQSHDDYKPPFIIYAQVIPIALLGLNELAVRLPSALAGVGAVAFTYLLCLELFPKRRKLALVAAFLLAVSPWHLQFTRTAYEVGIQPLLTTSGLYFFLRGIRTRKVLPFLLSGAILGLGTHLYTASRVFIPLMIGFLGLLYYKSFWQQKKLAVAWVIAMLVFLLPTAYLFTQPAGQTRFKGTNLFQDVVPHQQAVQRQVDDWLRGDNRSVILFHPEALEYLPQITQTYFSHLRPDFLFLGNTHPSTNYVPNTGLLYLWEITTVLAGLYFLFRKFPRRIGFVVLGWLLLSQLPAAVTSGVPTSIRATISLPVWQIVSALGLVSLLALIPTKVRLLAILGFTLVAGYFISYYLHMYYIHAPLERGKFWYTPYKQMIQDVSKLAPNYDRVIVSTEIDQPQSFFLFHTKYDPQLYWEREGGTVSGNYEEQRNHFANFYFRKPDYNKMSAESKTLFVGRPAEFSSNAHIIKEYTYPDGTVALVVFE